MTDEELVKLIRSSPWSDGFPYLSQTADRIEALVKEVQRLHGLFDKKHNLMLEQKARAERLTATLREIEDCTTEHGGAARALRIIHAALKGDDHV